MIQTKTVSTATETLKETSSAENLQLQQYAKLSALHQAQQFYEAIATPVLITSTDGKIIAANQSLFDILEFKNIESIFGKHWTEVIPDIDAEDLKPKTIALDGCTEKIQVLTISPDILNKKTLETYSNIFNHDFRNTLNGIVGVALASIQDPVTNNTKQELFLKVIKMSAAQAYRQLGEFKTLINLNNNSLQVEFESVDIIPHLQHLIDAYDTMGADHNVHVQALQLPETLCLQTNITLLEQVIENVLKNSWEATKRGAKVSVSVAEFPSAINLVFHHPEVIPLEIQQRLFKERVSTKGNQRGYGTLSMKLLTEKYLCGHIEFVSTPETGTIFTVTLPKNIQN
jgi:signal transduction histidine kinase